MIVWGKPLIDTDWNYGSMTSAKLTTVNPTIDIGDSNAEWQLPNLVQTHHPFRQLLAHAACGKNLKHPEHVWATLSHFEEPGVFLEHLSTHSEKLAVFSGQRTSSRTIFLRANLGRRYGIVGFRQFSTCPHSALKQLTFVETNAWICLDVNTTDQQNQCGFHARSAHFFSCIIRWTFALVVAFTSPWLVSS